MTTSIQLSHSRLFCFLKSFETGLITLFLAIYFIACSEKQGIPKNIIQPKMMQSIIWDNVRATVYATEFLKKDSMKNDSIELLNMQETIFRHYKVSRKMYEKSCQYYLQNPSKFNPILDSIYAQKGKWVFKKENITQSRKFD